MERVDDMLLEKDESRGRDEVVVAATCAGSTERGRSGHRLELRGADMY